MKSIRIGLFLVVALAQLSVPASVVWKRERTLKYGRLWKFKTEPVDPVDAVRGRYVALRMASERVRKVDQPPGRQKFPPGTVAYVSLKADAEGFAQVDQISAIPMKGDNVVRAEVGYSWGGWEHVRFPFDKLWVSEKTAPAAERAYLENSRRGNGKAYVTVRVRDGDAALERLYIGDQTLADYLRAHPSP